jgi:hypothetical protein
MDQNIKEITERYESKLQAELGAEVQKFKAGGQYEKRLSTEKKSELVARSRKVINADQLMELSGVIDMLAEEGDDSGVTKYYILIDKLDERWVDVSIRFRLIRSLVESLKSFRRIANLKIVVAIRADVLERVVQETGDLGFQREKFEDYFVRLKWSRPQLKELIQRRIGLLFQRQYSPARPITFEDIFSNRVGNMDAFDYMLERTLMRPRDIISFVNECLKRAEGRYEITAKLVREAEGEFSRVRRQALEFEWQSAFATLPRLIDYLKSFKKPVIQFSELCQQDAAEKLALAIAEKKMEYDPLFDPATKMLAESSDCREFMKEVLSILYRVGAVGVKAAPGERFQYSHMDQPILEMAGLADGTRLRIHPMLHRSLGIEGKALGEGLF